MPPHPRRLPSALAALALLAAAPLAAQPARLSPTEQAIARAVDVHGAESLALLERIVNINSGTLNLPGVRAVADALRPSLDALGFTTRWVDGAAFHRAGHLVAEHPGPGPKLLLIGHLDTVFEPSSPFQRFQRLDDSTARGPGIIDMKGGDVIAIGALRALRDVGALDRMHVVMVLDGDEEEAGEPVALARAALRDAARGAAAAIGFEDGPGDPRYAVISRRGDLQWTLRTTGTPAHSSQIFTPPVGAGAVFAAAHALDQIYQRLAGEPYLALNPGLAVGGTLVSTDITGTSGSAQGKSNVVAGRETVTGDLRTLSPEQLANAEQAMREVAAHPLPGTTIELTFAEGGYPPMAPTDGNRRLLALYDQASRDLGYGPVAAVDPARAGAADVSFVAGIVPMKIDGVGLSGHDDHTDRETADLRALPEQTKRAALLLYRLTAQAGAATP